MKRAVRRAGHALLVAVSLSLVSGPSRGAEPLPEPLTLEEALKLADEQHPDLALAEMDMRLADAERLSAESLTGLNAGIVGRLRWVDPPSVALDQSSADHQVGLLVTQNLYDSGRSRASRQAAARAREAGSLLYSDARTQRRLEIMQRYFEVLLADLQFLRDNEEMAVAYVALDRLRDRNELGQVSDIVVLEQEAEYQRVRRQRSQSMNQQRATRARLALALNRPGMLPATLILPTLPQIEREVPEDVAVLQEAADRENPLLNGLRAQLAAARERVAAARAGDRPILRGELEASAYAREMSSNDRWRAGVVLEVPITRGGTVEAAVARQQAEVYRLQAQLAKAEMDVRQAVLDAWLELDNLRIHRDQARTLVSYRDLYLDRSRALYELEVRTDLGDAMVRFSEAQVEAARADFQTALVWERLEALTGGMAGEATQAPGAEEQAGS